MRKMASLLEMDPSTYAFYEDEKRFKKAHLPIDLARNVAAVLADFGIARSEVMALAGIDPGPEGSDTEALTRSESHLIDLFRRLDNHQRSVVISVAEAIVGSSDRSPANDRRQGERRAA